jgi:DNA-binding transcriptional regulator YiaG
MPVADLTGAQLKEARLSLGLSAAGLARLLRMSGAHAARTVRRWESGELDIPGYVVVILDLALNVPAARHRLGLGLQRRS